MVAQPLLVAKCLVPIISPPLVRRPRLVNLLEAGLSRKLTVVSAPAGYGKSTLLADWAMSETSTEPASDAQASAAPDAGARRVAWVSLEPSDNTPAMFWQYVFMALERALPGSTGDALSAVQDSSPTSLEGVLRAFINARLAHPVGTVLILDDFHVITDSAIHGSLAFLLEHLPRQLHVVILTRTEAPLPLARLRARREVNELSKDSLRCTSEETATFLGDVMGVRLVDETLARMAARTEGWLVGLQLLGLSLQGRRDPEAVLEELSGAHGYVFDYLMDEVLRQQTEALQQFLLHTSVLERLSVPLCNALLDGNDAKAMLGRLASANLFLIALDERNQWFRYHPLFREALQSRLGLLDPSLVRGLHLRASEWFAAHGDSIAMTFHAIQAQSWGDSPKLSEGERRAQTGYLAAANAQRAALWGDATRAREFARMALPLLPQESLLERSAVAAAESTAALCDGHARVAHQFMREAAGLMQQAGHPIPALAQTAISALYLTFLGDLQAANHLLEEALEQAVQPGDSANVQACLVYVIQGYVLLERNRSEEALERVTQGTRLAQQLQFDAAVELGENILGLVHLSRGEYDAAQSALERAIQMPLQLDNAFQRALGATPILVRLWLAQGQLERALAWQRQPDEAPPLKSAFARERLDAARARVLLAARQPARALEIVQRLIPAASADERWDHVIELWLLEALAHDQNGDREVALEVLMSAVQRAEPQGYVRRFVDEGAAMADLLKELRHQRINAPHFAYLDRLLGVFEPAQTGSGLQTPMSGREAVAGATAGRAEPDFTRLTPRESEVLALMARGFSNEDVARRLALSRFTVKSHVGSLLSKLEAKNRTHAVARARAVGLLGPAW